jgi:hypothetical protein
MAFEFEHEIHAGSFGVLHLEFDVATMTKGLGFIALSL